MTTKTLRAGVIVASATMAAGLASTPAPAAPVSETLSWSLCSAVAKDWPGGQDDKRTECAMLTVPLDYANPQGRKIKIAVSRIKAADPAKRRGVLVANPGGPGLAGNLDFPIGITNGGLGTLAADHDLIGFDPRGTSYSDKIDCRETSTPALPPTATPKEKAKAFFDRQAEDNKRCAAVDPDFTRQLTTTNIARDVDAIRAALGESKISFFGVSFGTAIGANYRSLFDGRVDRMWLDSVMPPVMDGPAMNATLDRLGEQNFGEFVPWLAKHDFEYHFGTSDEAVRKTIFALRDKLGREPRVIDDQTVLDRDWVTARLDGGPRSWISSARDLATVLEGGVPRSARPTTENARTFGFENPHGGLNSLQYNAIMCNDGTGGRDFEAMWADKLARTRAYPATGGHLQFGIYCAGWPFAARPWAPVKGNSPLQLSGHTAEDTTPYAWAVATRDAVGGTLLTIQDGQHASLSRTPCAAKAIDFFRTGRVSGGTCPGAQ
ncbi:alpha/beta fold hydrolase [Amycolatopsis samaneae]|uniref:Alpha/beta fold hydrolase n=1 Tax=Amycolatopsis samaneae TaxID=664691 RepID=A0ABW5GSW5_9PSEU